MKELLIAWLVWAMNSMAPAHRTHVVPEAVESFEQADTRYTEIASAVVDVAFDETEAPLFIGANARSRMAMFLINKFYFESGFRRDVQYGDGRARYAESGLNDHGRSWCLGQLNLGKRAVLIDGKWSEDSKATTAEGWTGRELLDDINKCVRASLHAMRSSFGMCRGLPLDQRLAVYAAGKCDSDTGKRISERRFAAYRRLWQRSWEYHPKNSDAAILFMINTPDVSDVLSNLDGD